MKAIDVHGFGGGFTLGVAQAGYELVAKKGREVGFGVLNVLANRHLLPGDWEVESGDPSQWVPEEADLVFGNPPCSGFSTLSRKDFRGMDSTINECMWELVRYAGHVAPKIVAWESVQQAFRQGRPLMQALRVELEEISGKRYNLYHVLHNNASLGGASIRRRYFWVAVREDIEFGVESNMTRAWLDDKHRWQLERGQLERVPMLNDVLGDLEHLSLTMERQPYHDVACQCVQPVGYDAWERAILEWECTCNATTSTSSWWTAAHMHDGSGTVDGHDVFRSPTLARIRECHLEAEKLGDSWSQGERMSDVLRRIYERTGELPASWHYMSKKPMLTNDGEKILGDDGKPIMQPIRKDKRIIETDFAMGVNQPYKWRGDQMARVLTGGAVHLFVHPTQPRSFTHREAARIQGFPDAWNIWPVRNAADLGPGWGKGVPVHAGRWIADWAKSSMEGHPGSIGGSPLKDGDREWIIDVTKDYEKVLSKTC